MGKVYDTADGWNPIDDDARRVVKEDSEGHRSNPHYYRDGDSASKQAAYDACDDDLEDDD